MIDSEFNDADTLYMRRALFCAARARDHGEVPVGAVLISAKGEILAEAGNQQIGTNDPTAHAEVLVLRSAAAALKNYRLIGSTLYVTLEPCTMCCGAIVHARVARLIFASREPKSGAVVSAAQVLDSTALNHQVFWQEGLFQSESSALLKRFFSVRR